MGDHGGAAHHPVVGFLGVAIGLHLGLLCAEDRRGGQVLAAPCGASFALLLLLLLLLLSPLLATERCFKLSTFLPIMLLEIFPGRY